MPVKQYRQIGPWTINNPTPEDLTYVRSAVERGYCKYLVFCHENKDREGHTYHLQGYATSVKQPYSIRKWHEVLGPRFSVDPKFNGVQNTDACIAYCKGVKDGIQKEGSGEYEEYGTLEQGKRNDLHEACQRIKNGEEIIDIIDEDGKLCKYSNHLEFVKREYTRKREREQVLEEYQDFKPREWQQDVLDLIETEPDDRSVYWYWESTGNVGKSKITKLLQAKGLAYCPKVSKIQDIMYAYNGEKAIIFDIPRCKQDHMEHMYAAIEDFKNGAIFSSKYQSMQRIFKVPHIIVFANFQPDFDKLSLDRWRVREIGNPEQDERIRSYKKSRVETIDRMTLDNEPFEYLSVATTFNKND